MRDRDDITIELNLARQKVKDLEDEFQKVLSLDNLYYKYWTTVECSLSDGFFDPGKRAFIAGYNAAKTQA